MPNDLLRQMEEGMSSFSKGQRQIASYIIGHYEKAAYMTAGRLLQREHNFITKPNSLSKKLTVLFIL